MPIVASLRSIPVRHVALAALLLGACTSSTPSNVDAAGTDAPGTMSQTRPERYIRGDVATHLVIELDYVAGAEPRAGAESELMTRLASLLDKPAGIEIVRGDVITSRGASHAWTFEELTALGTETFDDVTAPGSVAMHVMWIDGHDAADTSSGSVLGVSWGNTHIAMFHDTIESLCGNELTLGDRACVEAQYGIWLHEVGHTIGLVHNGIDMVTGHEDGTHAAHDASSSCLMYWAYDGSAGVDMITSALLGGGGAPDFDANCLADIAAVRHR